MINVKSTPDQLTKVCFKQKVYILHISTLHQTVGTMCFLNFASEKKELIHIGSNYQKYQVVTGNYVKRNRTAQRLWLKMSRTRDLKVKLENKKRDQETS